MACAGRESGVGMAPLFPSDLRLLFRRCSDGDGVLVLPCNSLFDMFLLLRARQQALVIPWFLDQTEGGQ